MAAWRPLSKRTFYHAAAPATVWRICYHTHHEHPQNPVKTILTPQKRCFLTAGERPYTHSLSWAIGCGFGSIYCGAYCYAQKLPNWLYAGAKVKAGARPLIIKENAPELLEAQLARARDRRGMRIFMSPVTDPYQPLERKLRLTRRCLDVFARYDDLDLLLIQTADRRWSMIWIASRGFPTPGWV